MVRYCVFNWCNDLFTVINSYILNKICFSKVFFIKEIIKSIFLKYVFFIYRIKFVFIINYVYVLFVLSGNVICLVNKFWS